MQIPVGEPHSKSWEEFAGAGAPQLDFVFTVCDSAAAEACPVWPGLPLSAHWGVADPAAVEGDDAERSLAFRRAFHELEQRIRSFASLPIDSLDRVRLQRQLDEIGQASTQEAPGRGVTES
jgi:arsenate reductase